MVVLPLYIPIQNIMYNTRNIANILNKFMWCTIYKNY